MEICRLGLPMLGRNYSFWMRLTHHCLVALRCVPSSTRITGWSFEKGDHKEDAEQGVGSREDQIRGPRAALRHQSDDGNSEGGFFEDGSNHQGTIAGRIGGDEAKSNLPSQGASDEGVENA